MKTVFSASLLTLLLASHAQGQDGQRAAQPTTAAPMETPPLPPEEPPPPPEEAQIQAPQAIPQPSEQASTGQWVYTSQYGWLWMPYGAQYSYEPSTVGAYPYAYVYYPIYGWTWLTSPWIWGLGPLPYFGYYGPRHFAWYRSPGLHYSYRGRPGWGPNGHYQRGFGGNRGGMGSGHPGGNYHPGGGRGGGRR